MSCVTVGSARGWLTLRCCQLYLQEAQRDMTAQAQLQVSARTALELG